MNQRRVLVARPRRPGEFRRAVLLGVPPRLSYLPGCLASLRVLALAVGLLPVVSGCAAPAAVHIGCGGDEAGARPPIQHVVLVELQHPDDAAALAADSRRLLAGLPMVVSFTVGPHLEIGRESVDGAYDLGLVIGFCDVADYRAYLVHPDHVALVEAWKPRWRAVRMFDVSALPRDAGAD